MATIRERKRSDGSVRYCAVVRIRKGNAITYQEYKTFTHRSAALSWAKHREVELDNEALPDRKRHEPVALAKLIRRYIETAVTGSGAMTECSAGPPRPEYRKARIGTTLIKEPLH